MLSEFTRSQAGVVSRAQAVLCGVSDSAIASRVRAGRWQRVYPGVFATFTGDPPWPARLWAAVLYAAPGAVLSHGTAAHLHGLAEPGTGPIHVSVPRPRQVKGRTGLVVHQVADQRRLEHTAAVPPRTRVEETVLDLADGWYDDVVYPGFGLHVELDGRLAHPGSARFRDHRRDNAAVVDGGKVLRYGYADVVGRPCTVATEVAGVLAASGWAGAQAFCPDCLSRRIPARHSVEKSVRR